MAASTNSANSEPNRGPLLPLGRFEWERIVRRALMAPTTKLVALAMATYADPDGTRVRPGEKRLALVCGTSERTIRRAVTDLRDRGLLHRTRAGSRAGRYDVDEYQLAAPADLIDTAPLLDPDEGCGPAVDSRPESVDGGSTTGHPRPVDSADHRTPVTATTGHPWPGPPDTGDRSQARTTYGPVPATNHTTNHTTPSGRVRVHRQPRPPPAHRAS